MESYFTRNIRDTGRFFFIFGLTKDRFCEDNHVAVDLDHILYKHLKDMGYKRIIFYSREEQLYFYDRESFNSTKEPNEVSKERIVEKSANNANRLQGPISGKLKSASNVSDQNNSTEQTEVLADANTDKLHFGKMDAKMAFDRIDYCIKDKKKTKIKTVAVFTNADDFINYFTEDIDREVYDSFNQYDNLGTDNDNIVIFVFPEGNQCEIIAREKYNNTFFKEKISATNTININPPAIEEIRNTINHYRLMHGLKVDFKCLDTVCKRIARKLCKKHSPLEWLMRELKIIAYENMILDTNYNKIFNDRDNETAMQQLNKLIGMENVKREIMMLESIKNPDEKPIAIEKHHSRILPPVYKKEDKHNLHYRLTGNPGTGKTTAAKLLGEIYYELGYLESGHTVKVSRDDLVSDHVGGTAIKTKGKIEEAMGGVLFIDEAYTLAKGGESDFGQEAVDTLVEAMTDRNGLFAVVVAGYPKEMEDFLNLNPGLKDRFESKLHIEDYTPSELLDIFNMNMNKGKFCSSKNLSNIIMDFLNNWYGTRDENWSNARGVEKLINRMHKNWALRKGEKTVSGEPILDTVDIEESLQKHCKPSEKSKEDAMSELNKLTGLSRVKEKIEELKLNVKFKGATEPGHYVFAGKPGTGKTTVARLLGEILREEGVLRRGHVVEVNRENLVAGYEGQTADKTVKVLEKALDGIFFLDEAYRLNQGGSEVNFGKEAIDTILTFMENNHKRICVIFAGYTGDMEKFIQTNDGLESRISETIIFDDYETDEMTEILHNFAKDFVLEPEYIQKSRQIFDYWIANKTSKFGNARDVRKYFRECETTLYKRLTSEYKDMSDIPNEAKKTLTGLDIPSKYLSIIGGSK
jgi:SpoVK/Ycf46/Vps4 family AAA+-type ATPase